MTLALLFWIIAGGLLAFEVWAHLNPSAAAVKSTGSLVLLFVLIAIIGWRVFGPAVHG